MSSQLQSRLLLIETSTSLCSAALAENGVISEYMESSEPRAHASKTAVFVNELLSKRGLKVSDCDAVCVSAGPGSYTGLRVGSSTAKGLCFGAGIPLIGVPTLDILAAQAQPQAGGFDFIVPMIDARRMEVYTAVYERKADAFERISEVEPRVIDGGSFADILARGRALFIGDGAGKCRGIIGGESAGFVQCCPRADAMLEPALQRFAAGQFENTAYFEPFYLKEFIATVSKKSLF